MNDDSPYRHAEKPEQFETCTTSGKGWENPARPKGVGWRLVASCPCFDGFGHSTGSVFWYWERSV